MEDSRQLTKIEENSLSWFNSSLNEEENLYNYTYIYIDNLKQWRYYLIWNLKFANRIKAYAKLKLTGFTCALHSHSQAQRTNVYILFS